jgi:carbon storage regulator
MLIISRKTAQKIVVAGDIEITILEIGRNRVRFGIEAPKHIPVHTRLKTTEIVENVPQAVETQPPTPPLKGLPAAAGNAKRR